MKKKYMIIIIIIGLCVILAILNRNRIIHPIVEKISIQFYGEPIEDGVINNKYFKINSRKKEAESTTSGINEALLYCNKRNIKNVKLEKGDYLIDNSISIPSNINLDLNNSSIYMMPNKNKGYILLKMSNTVNTSLYNGNLIGDREEHEYIEDSTHEWGMGISVIGGENISIQNMNIEKMTGDGIYITNGRENSNNINIMGCSIHNNRRQGISIISAENVEIRFNEIYNINGTLPQSGIDLEANNTKQKIDKIQIHDNKLYNFKEKLAIILYKQIYNIDIFNNELYGNIKINDSNGIVRINNNKILSGIIEYDKNNANIFVENND